MLESTANERTECITPNPFNDDNEEENIIESTTTTESSESETSPTHKHQKKHRKRPFTTRMLNLGKEVTIMCFIAVAYAALTNETPPKIGKSPAAYPFFPTNSLVTDWYRGEISAAIEQARASDIAFVMFYAPWDAASQAARSQFERAADIMHRYVSFASVNCWQPGSECKKQYGKVYKWPVLIAYPTHGRGIQYNGPIEAMHMVRFLQNMCKPYQMAVNIREALHGHDSIIVGTLNVGPGSREFGVFYSTALRYLEKDHLRDVNFAILPKTTIESRLTIYNWNETIIYTGTNWDVEEISAWISKNLHLSAPWVQLTGMKSATLSKHIQPGPAIILFTPKNPLGDSNDYHDLFREVAYDYKNCKNSNSIIDMRLALIKLERKRNRWRHLQLRENCIGPESLLLKTVKTWGNNSVCTNCACSFGLQKDPLASDVLQKNYGRKECQNFILGEKYSRSVFEKNQTSDLPKITGIGCNNNNLTLQFATIDSLMFYHFGEKLGIELKKDKSGVIIIDDKSETHYILRERQLTTQNLRNFIKNFTESSVERSLTSSINRRPLRALKTNNNDKYSVIELKGDGFLDFVLKPGQTVIVFYYSKQCAFCSGVSYAFLSAAKLLEGTGISFARIDGDNNLLPWEYTMESYPTILFFPAYRKAESRALPQNIPITVPNLIRFILTNLEREQKLKSMWIICKQAKFKDEKMKCMASVRSETLGIIGDTLKEWRIVDYRHKSLILHKLQVLRQLHLLFAHNPHEESRIHKQFFKLNGRHKNFVSVKDEL